MKLYTEDDLKEAFNCGRLYQGTHDDTNIYHLIDKLTPIELPSDEEIEEKSRYKPTENIPYNPLLNLVWIEGAKSMRDKIQQVNSEQ